MGVTYCVVGGVTRREVSQSWNGVSVSFTGAVTSAVRNARGQWMSISANDGRRTFGLLLVLIKDKVDVLTKTGQQVECRRRIMPASLPMQEAIWITLFLFLF